MRKIIIVLPIILIIVAIIVLNKPAHIELTQISARSDDSMMSYIIKTSNNKTIVIDGGIKTEAKTLKHYINEYGNKVDYWFITHPHKDHVGAFIDIVENTDIEIKNIYYSVNSQEWYNENEPNRANEVEEFYKAIQNERIQNALKIPQIGDDIKIGKNINIEILQTASPEITYNAINNSSMVFKIHVNDRTILMLGDIGTEASEKLINRYGKALKSDIVQMSHHGQSGATEEFYKLVQPEICLWQSPQWLWDNVTGTFKTLETRKWMENIGVKTNYVAKDGDITITVE